MMNKYTIYCTSEQTRKALSLGAPLEIYDIFDSYDIREANIFYKDKFIELPDGRLIERIIAEQMIGWLEEQESIKSIVIDKTDCWQYVIWGSIGNCIWCDTNYNSRSEATLVAIDAALEYLSNKKK